MDRTLPKSAGAGLVPRRARYRARKRASTRASDTKSTKFPAAMAALTVGNLATNSAGSAGAGGTKPNRMTGTKMKTIPPSMPASPPHRRTLFSSIDFPLAELLAQSILAFAMQLHTAMHGPLGHPARALSRERN